MPFTTDALVQLAGSHEPDATETLVRADFLRRLHDEGLPMAEFQGIGYALGVYLSEDLDGYAVAPSAIGGPPRAMAQAEVRWFYDDRLSGAYARACLWALQAVVGDIAAEELA